MPIGKLLLVLSLAAGFYAAAHAAPGDAAYPLRTALRRVLVLNGEPPLALAPSETSRRFLIGVAVPADAFVADAP